MRTIDEHTIADDFMCCFGDGADPRFREIMLSLARHPHAFTQEVNLTHAEWFKGIEFMERAGRISDAEPNEFVLFSDVVDLPPQVDMLISEPAGTSSSVLGPFHIAGTHALPSGGDLKREFGGQVPGGQREGCRP